MNCHSNGCVQQSQLFTHLFKLLQALNFFVYHVPFVDKQIALWAQGLVHLTLIWHHGEHTFSGKELKAKFKNISLHPSKYTFSFFSHSNITYVRLPISFPQHQQMQPRHFKVDSKHIYIGSTKEGLPKREWNRISKYKQVTQEQLVHVEPAIRYWARNNTFYQHTVLVLSAHDTYQQAWCFEHLLIQRWQPHLNYPHILRHFRRKSNSFVRLAVQHRSSVLHTGVRLWRKLRKHTFCSVAMFQQHTMERLQAWDLLYRLAENSKRSFEACRYLRSGAVLDAEIYAIYRLTNVIEQPQRSKLQGLFHKVMQFRNMTRPRSSQPIRLPFLAHPEYRSRMAAWLRKFVLEHKEIAVPFHLPSAKVQEAANPSLSTALWNWRQAAEHWTPQTDFRDLSCSCDSMLKKHPLLETLDGHIASGIEQLTFTSTRLQALYQWANAQATFYPHTSQVLTCSAQALKKWADKHGLPSRQLLKQFEQFFDSQISSHKQFLRKTPKYTAHNLQQFKKLIPKDMVVHNEDHGNSHLMIYCPKIYLKALQATWNDAALFQPIPNQPDGPQFQLNQVPQQLKRHYKWAFPASLRKTRGKLQKDSGHKPVNKQYKIPTGQAFLKRKKSWKKGRTIIGYHCSVLTKLTHITAVALADMLTEVWPSTLGTTPTPELFQKLHKFFDETSSDIDLVMYNDDLVGFFNSIPQDKVLFFVDHLIKHYKAKHPDIHTLSVNTQSSCKHNRTTSGSLSQHHQHTQVKSLRLDDILPIVQTTFDTAVFSALNTTWLQVQGSPIGSKISPALCSICVAGHEMTWRQTYHIWRQSPGLHLLLMRYVDNRLTIVDQQHSTDHPLAVWLHKWFYGRPIEVEEVEDINFLGFDIYPHKRQVKFIDVDKPWKVRSPANAGTNNLTLSGFRSRAHLIVNYSFPKELIPGSLSALLDLYHKAGFSFSILQDSISQEKKPLPVIATGVCVCGTLLAKGMHVLFLPFLVPSFTSGFMSSSSISRKETKRDKRSSRCPLCWAWAS